MADDWILEVLEDLSSFARLNGLNALARELDNAAVVAMAELSGRDVGLAAGFSKPKLAKRH
ncbi:hypothetical protein [Actibacterium sp. XHP0104]|uniref:hypothetical protein n=1 Tax=Actibacterium sp. XHP0104 TaxID=2984335 RepID=UPI0021E79F2C|nr:hypothetical protein [Actibacterium sp. XHP0104]MCV2882653.1 hypothetical protein [Actibacterium sp. XHP0104]